MRYEKIKSIALTLLVGISIFLTWNLWTFQPSYETIESTKAYNVSISDKKQEKTLIKPYKLFYHHGGQISGTSSENEMDKVTKAMSNWTLFDIKDVSNQYSQEELERLVHGEKKLEIVFPDNVPLSVYGKVLNFEEEKLPKTSFNQIIVDLNVGNPDTGSIYFVSYGQGKKVVLEGRVDMNSVKSLEKTFVRNAIYNYESYFKQRLNDKKTLLLPDKAEDYISYRYYTELIKPEDFKRALFNDPNNVIKDITESGETYTDDKELNGSVSGK